MAKYKLTTKEEETYRDPQVYQFDDFQEMVTFAEVVLKQGTEKMKVSISMLEEGEE
jgi:hypothetical protein